MTRIVLTRGVREYRETIDRYVSSADPVLEVGCAFGTTSKLLSERAGSLVAVDKSVSIKDARATYPEIRFEQLDAFDISAIRSLGSFSKIYVDLSGSRTPEPVMALVRRYEAVLTPDVIVVKNTRLKRFVARCVVWPDKGQTTGEFA